MKIPVQHFDLQHTLDSGQFFRYTEYKGWFYCQVRDSLFRVKQSGNTLTAEGNISEKEMKRFFALDDNYEKVISELEKDPELKPAVQRYEGMRILKQDPWECTVGFVCSSFSNIKRIKYNLNCIAKQFGMKQTLDDVESHTMPRPGGLDSLQKLKQCSLGYRAEYLYELNKMVDEKFFLKLEKMNYEEAKAKLMELPGIGEKVADCICLFSLGKGEAFPVDVWIERAMEPLVGTINHNKIQAFAAERWGEIAGYAQQFLYHEIRLRQHKTS